jgi:polysaccharide export outer membrane protein
MISGSDFHRRDNRRVSAVVFLCGLILATNVSARQNSRAYVVGPADVLAIAVFDQPLLTGRYTVQPDGTFTFPLVGAIKAGGNTVQEIEVDIRTRLAAGYLKSPQVSVSIEQYRSQQVFVMGEVRQPTGLPYTGPMTLMEALARAGSLTERAGTEALVLRRPAAVSPPDAGSLARAQSSPDSNSIRVDLRSLQAGKLSEDVVLRPGDTVFVPKAQSIFVSGQVNRPGEFTYQTGMTVRQVIALAGGVTDRGSTRRVQIVRQVDGVETTLRADLKDSIKGGDTVVVRERFF